LKEDDVNKATRRIWRKQQTRHVHERQIADQVARERRLKGFKPATTGDMLAEVSKRGAFR